MFHYVQDKFGKNWYKSIEQGKQLFLFGFSLNQLPHGLVAIWCNDVVKKRVLAYLNSI